MRGRVRQVRGGSSASMKSNARSDRLFWTKRGRKNTRYELHEHTRRVSCQSTLAESSADSRDAPLWSRLSDGPTFPTSRSPPPPTSPAIDTGRLWEPRPANTGAWSTCIERLSRTTATSPGGTSGGMRKAVLGSDLCAHGARQEEHTYDTLHQRAGTGEFVLHCRWNVMVAPRMFSGDSSGGDRQDAGTGGNQGIHNRTQADISRPLS